MVCEGLESLTDTGISGILSYPNTCFNWFWGLIIAAIFFVIALSLYFRDRDRQVNPDFMSILGVSSLASIMIALAGSLLGLIQKEVFSVILAVGLVFVIIWLIKRN